MAMIIGTWGMGMLQTAGKIDAVRMYLGVSAEGMPYVEGPKDVQTPIFFAFARSALSLTDGSLASYIKMVNILSYLSLSVVLACVLCAALFAKRKGRSSLSGAVPLLCVCIAGLLPAFKNIEVGNLNIWVAGLVAIHLLTVHLTEDRLINFLGGAALGAAFMIKPYLIIVLAFLLFSSFRNKRFAQLAGLVTAGILGFFASLMVQGIDLDTYRYFLFDARRNIYFLWPKHSQNLSLLKWVPKQFFGIAGLISILALTGLAFLDSRRPKSKEVYWFFVTLLPFPIIWGAHLMGIFPAFAFLLLERDEEEQILISAAAALVVFISIVMTTPMILNALLLALWAWGVRPLHLRPDKA